jgi:hypothetical protein
MAVLRYHRQLSYSEYRQDVPVVVLEVLLLVGVQTEVDDRQQVGQTPDQSAVAGSEAVC